MANTDITLKNGDISAYGFMCGYVQTASVGPIIPDHIARDVEDCANRGRDVPPSSATVARYEVRLASNGTSYDVKRRDYSDLGPDTTVWDQYETLGEARRAFRRMTRESA